MVAHKDMVDPDVHEPKGISDATSGQLYVADGSGSGSWTSFSTAIPVGSIMDYAGSSAPSGWLLCYGQAISRTTYASLFAAISTTYGVGDGSSTFNLPDLRGRVAAGKDNMGGSSANRLTDADDGLDGDVLGDTGGGETQTLVTANLAAHTHAAGTLADSGHTHGSGSYAVTAAREGTAVSATGGSGKSYATDGSRSVSGTSDSGTATITGSTASAGSDTPFGVVQPTIILNKIIYTSVS